MMRKLCVAAMLGALILGMVSYATAGTVVRQMSTLAAVTVATSAELDTTTAIGCTDYSYIGAVIEIDWASGGSAGNGQIYFEGRASDSDVWSRIWIIDPVDSMEVMNQIDWGEALAADKNISAIITILPSGYWDDDDATHNPIGGTLANVLPYTEIRCIVNDNDWNAVATFRGYWILRK
ncbi:MAG TPA: hypothetical protein VMV78_08285 [Thiobacillus sp.]|nr:hypothetical protein [Thiobacillus sp.]